MALNVTLNFKKELQKGKIVFGQTIGPRNDPDKTVKAIKEFGLRHPLPEQVVFLP